MSRRFHIIVKKALIDRGMHYSDLADATGISRVTIYRILRGGNTTWENIQKIMDVLNLEIRVKE